MSQTEGRSESSPTASGSRQENYLRWRERLAAKQAVIRGLGKEDERPALNPAWSPDALFEADGGRPTAVVDVRTQPVPDETALDRGSVGERLQELNRLRVEGALNDEEFNRRKAAVFAERSATARSSIEPPPDLEQATP
jgi:hypothetical protein